MWQDMMRMPERRLDLEEPPIVYCPRCGEENPETMVVEYDGTVVGCSECLLLLDPEEYAERRRDDV